MPKQESPLAALTRFLPPGTFGFVAPFFQQHIIHLTLTRHRRSLHGDYRPPSRPHPYHRISVNATLNPYNFLITLLHELAHLTTVVQYGTEVAPHGTAWKEEFRKVLRPLMGSNVLPQDIARALQAYCNNPAASTCTDPQLYKTLARYDAPEAGLIHADDVAVGSRFELSGRTFEKLENLRTRSRCKDVATGRIYFVQGIARVKPVSRAV